MEGPSSPLKLGGPALGPQPTGARAQTASTGSDEERSQRHGVPAAGASAGPDPGPARGRGARRFAGRCLIAAILSVFTLLTATCTAVVYRLVPGELGVLLWCAGLLLVLLDLPAATLTMLFTHRHNPRAFRRASAAFGVAILSLGGHALIGLYAVCCLGRPFSLPGLF